MAGPVLEAGGRLRIPDRHVAGQRRLMVLAASGQKRGGHGNAHAAAEISHHVVGRSGVGQPLHRDGSQGEGLERHEGEPLAQPLDEPGQGERVVVHAERDIGHQDEGGDIERAADSEQQPLIHAGHQAARDQQRGHVADPARRQHQARGPRVVGHHLLGVERQQDGARVEAEPHARHHQGAHREVPVVEHGEVEDGLIGGQLAIEEAGNGEGGEHGEHSDVGGLEPVRPLPAVEHELERAEADHHQDQTLPVDRGGLARIGGVEEEGARHEESHHADGQVHVEDPAPGPVVADPAAQRGAEDGGHHDAHAPDGHGEAALAEREDLPHGGLRHGDDGAAPQALDHSHDDEKFQIGREAREERGRGEHGRAEEEEAAPAQEAGEPRGGGDRDGIRGEIGGEHPGRLLHARRQRALHVGERHVGDAGVDHLGDGDQHHRDRDQPLPCGGERGRRMRVLGHASNRAPPSAGKSTRPP